MRLTAPIRPIMMVYSSQHRAAAREREVMPDVEITNATSILKKYFGMKEGQKLTDFAPEIRELRESMTPEEYHEFLQEVANELGEELKYKKK